MNSIPLKQESREIVKDDEIGKAKTSLTHAESESTKTIKSEPQPKAKYVEIPDKSFGDYLKRRFPCAFNKEGKMNANSVSIKEARELQLGGKGIGSLKGIQYFIGLKVLPCRFNPLTSLDVSKNTKLEVLSCGENQLTSLNLNNNKKLESLECSGNRIRSLNLEGNRLTELICYNNPLTYLNIRRFKAYMESKLRLYISRYK